MSAASAAAPIRQTTLSATPTVDVGTSTDSMDLLLHQFAEVMVTAPALVLVLVASASALLGAFVVYWRSSRHIADLRAGNRELATRLELEREGSEEKMALVEDAEDHFRETFAALAGRALQDNSESLIRLAQANLAQFHIKSRDELALREKSIERLLGPIKDALAKTEAEVRRMERERTEAFGSISKHLEAVAETQHQLHGETRNLVQALRRPEVRGRWGEMTLRRVVELAGMVEHCDFYEQEQVETEGGSIRPDMVIRMVEGREIVVDAKTPLEAYLNAVDAGDESSRNAYLRQHARNMRNRVKELSGKAYWRQFDRAPDFVVLFIPGDQFLSAALDMEHNLLEEALRQKVVLATPTSFMGLMRSIAYGWRQLSLAKNAERIRSVGEDLYDRLANFSEHLVKLGKNLDACVSHYNRAVGSYDTRLLPSARRFVELGLTPKQTMEPLTTVDRQSTPPFERPTESDKG